MTRRTILIILALSALPIAGRAAPAPQPTPPIVLGEEEYRDRVRACWLGKRIGAALGAPYQGKKEILRLRYYDPVPGGPAPVDGMDIQLVWLKMLAERGSNPSLQDFAAYWQVHLATYPWNEYGFCARNLERGLLPPVSGWFENSFIDESGAMVRSEVWACVAPADPQRAASLAWRDAQLDHAGGEGAYAEVFWAAVQSAAFALDDPETLIRVGLERIPPSCAVARAVREALWCSQNGKNWEDARNRVARAFGKERATYAPADCGFAVIGWLYGQSFGDRLCKAANCGYDPARTAATLGGLLGVLGGTAGIPEPWRRPVGEEILLNGLTRGLNRPEAHAPSPFLDGQPERRPPYPGAPANIPQLVAPVFAAAQRLAGSSDRVRFGPASHFPDDTVTLLLAGDPARPISAPDPDTAVLRAGGLTVTIDYRGEPVLRPGVPKVLGVSVDGAGPEPVHVSLKAPAGWRVSPLAGEGGETRFLIHADDVRDRQSLTAVIAHGKEQCEAGFVLLGPGEAKGYASGEGVPTCDKCGARKEACVCANP